MKNNLFQPDCRWVWHPEHRTGSPGYVSFRLDFQVETECNMQFNCSADNRYILFLDGKIIQRGPVRGDLENYHFDTVNISVPAGKHILEAEVVVWGQNHRTDPVPWGEIHDGGGWLLAGFAGNVDISTPGQWVCRKNSCRKIRDWQESSRSGYVLPVPPMEEMDFSSENPESWTPVVPIGRVYLRDSVSTDNDTRWLLTPKMIPELAEIPHIPQKIARYGEGVQLAIQNNGTITGSLPSGKGEAVIMLSEYFTGFCNVKIEAEGNGKIDLEWAEALCNSEGAKGQRDETSDELELHGVADRLIFQPGSWKWSPFTWRCGRFVKIAYDLDTPATLNLAFTSYHYPFECKASLFIPDSPELSDIARICWNTALACAHEHYEDCPYYEQMQYAGDTRIQALISYRVTGDGRLGKQALYQFAQSTAYFGLTSSRYPANWRQYIPGFSLIWILMIFDHYQYFGDRKVVEDLLPVAKNVLGFFARKMLPEGIIGSPGYWDIIDWTPDWNPPGSINRGTGKPAAIHSLMYALCCKKIADFTGEEYFRTQYISVIQAVNKLFFDMSKGLYRDVPDENWFSRHTNAMALLAGAVPAEYIPKVLSNLFGNDELTDMTTYFKAYLFDVISQYHVDNVFEKELDIWRKLLSWGFATVPEAPRLSARSDCHAWGASPIGYFVTILLGITPLTPGFGRVAVAPLPGSHAELSGKAPIGQERMLSVKMKRKDNVWEMTLTVTGGNAEVVPGFPGKEWENPLILQENMPVTIREM